MTSPSAPSLGRGRALVVACCVVALVRAYQLRWTCDDAFISFRYAKNFATGHGLVFNVGERVEGYTNFLWTLLVTPAIALGVRPEIWTQLWGAAFYAATIAVLGAASFGLARRAGAPAPVPVLGFAAIAGCVHREWAVFAVSGLETSAFTFFAVAGYVFVLRTERRDAAMGGALVGLATLCRPDGAIFGVAAGAWLVARALLARRSGASPRDALVRAAIFVAAFGAIASAHELFRLAYYGELLPNTYYAKSGDRAWYPQGVRYLWLYLLRYWPIALAPLAMIALVLRAAADRAPASRAMLAPASLATLFGLSHAFWVVRVGGDFMFGRFLVPSTPFLLLVVESALVAAVDGAKAARRTTLTVAAAGAVALIAVLPTPMFEDKMNRGIVDERAFYTAERVARIEQAASRVRPLLAGLDARLAFYSAQARFAYRLDVPVAIECETGLTDAVIARQPLERRLRVGHEKKAPPGYVVSVRKAHLAYVSRATPGSPMDRYVPFVSMNVGGVRMQLLHWDPAFVLALRSRGVDVPDYPTFLDRLPVETMDIEAVRLEHERARHFYFDFVPDPAREQRFLDRITPK